MTQMYVCPNCNGDGRETCHNPDHGFIGALSFTGIGRIGCPCCGHDAQHKVPKGGKCETCNGTGDVPLAVAEAFISDMEYDIEPEPRGRA